MESEAPRGQIEFEDLRGESVRRKETETPAVTILMPCLNEIETLATCIGKAKKWAEASGREVEILVADNGSTDGSQEAARSLGARIVDVAERGYGNALYYGIEAARGDFVIMADSDDSYDFSNLTPFVEAYEAGAELVIGNRFLGGIHPGAMPWKNRYIGNPILTFIGKLLFRSVVNDFHCGLRGITKDAFFRLDLRTTGMEFASEMVIKATIMSLRIVEVPTTLDKDGRSRPPHLRPGRDGWRHLRFMLIYSPRWLFLVPGLILTILSIFAYASVYLNFHPLDGVEFGIHTLFFTQASIVIGLSAVFVAIAIRIFGARENLLSEHALLNTLNRFPILEAGAIFGIFISSLGGYLGYNALNYWMSLDFGLISDSNLIKTVSLSTLLLTVGGIVFVYSLLLGFFVLTTRSQR